LRELGGVAQSYEFAVKHHAPSVEGRSQTFEKQATIAAGENVNRKKEVRFACDPAPVRSDAAVIFGLVVLGDSEIAAALVLIAPGPAPD
jgi:hypothetical protein